MDGIRKGGNLKDVCPSLGPAAQAASSQKQKNTQDWHCFPSILPAGRNLGQITEVKLTGKLDCRISTKKFTLSLAHTLFQYFVILRSSDSVFSSHWEKNLAGSWQYVASQWSIHRYYCLSFMSKFLSLSPFARLWAYYYHLLYTFHN